MIGLNINRSYIIGLCLCALFLTKPAFAELNQQKVFNEIKQAYSLLFLSKKQQLKQSYVKSYAKNYTKSHVQSGVRRDNWRERVLWIAKKQLRKRYRWGGTSPITGFDCSGLMQYAYKSVKVDIPRTAREQYKYAKRIPLSKLQAGDLIFFHTRRTRARVNHVGLYLGDGEFIHAPRSGKRISIAKLNKYWRRKAVAAGRI